MSFVIEQFEATTALTKEEQKELKDALIMLGDKLLRTTCGLFNVPGKLVSCDEGHRVQRAYHSQEGLPEGYEIAVWSGLNTRTTEVKLFQQIVKWEEDDTDIGIQPASTLAWRPKGPQSLVVIPGLNYLRTSYEESMRRIDNIDYTVDWFAEAHGYNILERVYSAEQDAYSAAKQAA